MSNCIDSLNVAVSFMITIEYTTRTTEMVNISSHRKYILVRGVGQIADFGETIRK